MLRGALTALVLVSLSRVAAADPNDIVLSRLGTHIMGADGSPQTVGESRELRALTSQLGVVLAPQILTPADTLGFGGFQFDVAGSETSIDSKAAYWRARAGSTNTAGADGVSNGPSFLRTVGFFAHKGLWFPLPSFEIGAGAVHLIDSTIWTGQLYVKFGLHEGYHELPIPSVAVRAGVSRMMSQRELDLTVTSVDVTVSKHFGIGGTWRFDPFAGWDLLLIVPRSEVIDATPGVDPLKPGNEMDTNNNFVFRDQTTILRNRFMVGAKFQYNVLQLTVEAQYALAGTSVDDRSGTSAMCQPNSTTANCDSKDTAAAQTTISVSAGIDF